jgi:cell division protein YceG involved in septum cleavage
MSTFDYNIDRPKQGKKKIFGLLFLLLLIIGAVFVVYYFSKINQAGTNISSPVNYSIEKGEGIKRIAYGLEKERIINNPNIFMVYAFTTNAARNMKAGNYVLDRKMSIVEVVDVLTAGKVSRQDKKVTLIEGWSNSQIKNYLIKRNVPDAEDFDSILKQELQFAYTKEARPLAYQGFIFPDTYELGGEQGLKN